MRQSVSRLLVFLLFGVAIAGTTLCQPNRCNGHGQCDPDSGACTCAAGFTGPYCAQSDCSGHGFQHPNEDACRCRMGWDGPTCATCAAPGHTHRFVCVATRTGYTLAYVTLEQYAEIMNGKLHLSPGARHRSMLPDRAGFDGRHYDCECRPGNPAKKRQLALASKRVEDAEPRHEFTPRSVYGCSCTGWWIATLSLGVVALVLLVLTVYFGVSRAQWMEEYRRLQAGKTVLQPYQEPLPVAPTPPPGIVQSERISARSRLFT